MLFRESWDIEEAPKGLVIQEGILFVRSGSSMMIVQHKPV
jgi:hypothetical protein